MDAGSGGTVPDSGRQSSSGACSSRPGGAAGARARDRRRAPRRAIGAGVDLAERLGLPARPVQGQRELSPEPLAQRILGDQLTERRDGELVLAEPQPSVDLVLERGRPQLVEPVGLGDRRRCSTQVLEWLASPEPESGSQFLEGRWRRPAAAPRAARPLPDEGLEAVGVERSGSTSSRYPAPTVRNAGRPAPDPSPSVRRRYDTCTWSALDAFGQLLLAPHLLDEGIGGNHLAHHNNSAVNRARGGPGGGRSAPIVPHLERTEDGELHAVRVTTGKQVLVSDLSDRRTGGQRS